MSTTQYNHDYALRLANVEHNTRMGKFAALKARVLDRSLSMELRLRAHMEIDAMIWARRSVVTEYAAAEDDKITISKKEAERKRLAVLHAERFEAGARVRAGGRHVVGRWSSTERGDSMAAPPPGICINCGKRYDTLARVRSRACSRRCARAAYEARKKLIAVNHGPNGEENRPAVAGH